MKTKSMKKKIFTLLLAVVMVFAFGLSACSDGDTGAATGGGGGVTGDFAQPARDLSTGPIKIAFVPLGASGPTMPTAMRGYYDALGGEDNGIFTIDVFDSQFDTTKQLQIMQDLITQKYDAILLEANDANALNDVISEAEAAGIPVITRNVGSTGPRIAHTLNSDYRSGWEAGKFIQENAGKPDDANVIVLDVVAELKATTRMGTGFEDYTKENTNWNLLESQPVTDTSQENGNTLMSALLAKYDKIDIVYTVSDDVAVGALQAIESAGREGDNIIIWGYEGHPLTLQAIKEGRIYGTSFADVYQQAYSTMVLIKYFMETGITAEKLGMDYFPTIEFVTVPITKDNIDEVLTKAGVTLE
jgi:ABC-type sugar transport system substrate-binding protein